MEIQKKKKSPSMWFDVFMFFVHFYISSSSISSFCICIFPIKSNGNM